MRKSLLLLMTAAIALSGCFVFQSSVRGAVPPAREMSGEEPTAGEVLPDSLLDSYYLAPDDPVFAYLQHKSIRRFFNMWLENDLGGDIRADWNYDTLAPVLYLDHDFNSLAKPETRLYTCTFSADDGRCGYIIVSYSDDGPSISKWSLLETTPFAYDLRANSGEIAKALAATDIDLSTATAARAEWIDTDRNRGDRIILFTDGKGGRYVCYLGDGDYTVEKR